MSDATLTPTFLTRCLVLRIKKALQRSQTWLLLSILPLKQTPPYTHPHSYAQTHHTHSLSWALTCPPSTPTYTKAHVLTATQSQHSKRGGAEALRQTHKTRLNPQRMWKWRHTDLPSLYTTHRPHLCMQTPARAHRRAHSQGDTLTHPVRVCEPVHSSLSSSSWAQPASSLARPDDSLRSSTATPSPPSWATKEVPETSPAGFHL